MSSNGTRSPVILHGSKDWDEWIAMIKIVALAAKIWIYINPDAPKDQLPTLEEPPKPSHDTVRNAAPLSTSSQANQPGDSPITLSSLTDREFNEYQVLHSEWILTRIHETISHNLFTYTMRYETVHDILVRLKNGLAPKRLAREAELFSK